MIEKLMKEMKTMRAELLKGMQDMQSVKPKGQNSSAAGCSIM